MVEQIVPSRNTLPYVPKIRSSQRLPTHDTTINPRLNQIITLIQFFNDPRPTCTDNTPLLCSLPVQFSSTSRILTPASRRELGIPSETLPWNTFPS